MIAAPNIAAKPTFRVDSTGHPVGVDREAAIIRGVIIAEAGSFRTTGRGRFTMQSLNEIVRLLRAEPYGARSRFRHPDLISGTDPLGAFLGRFRNIRLDLTRVRGDLKIDPTAMREPVGGGRPLGTYLMELAESDHSACGASLVLIADKLTERDARGRALTDSAGKPLPPVWMPTTIHGIDIVDQGDATSSLLGIIDEPTDATDDDLLRVRWKNKKRRAGVLDQPNDELLQARCRNKKRRAGIVEQPTAELLRMQWRNKKRKAGTL
jgi:hypothetical protein